MSLTEDEANDYLTEVLGLKTWKKDLEASKYLFISRVFQAWLINIPFHNLAILENRDDLEFSSEQEVVDKVLSGVSVMCAGNVFLKCLFTSLGLKAFLLPCILNTRRLSPQPEGKDTDEAALLSTIIHLAVGVECPRKDSEESSMHFIDIGSGLPLTEPVPLDRLPYRRSAGGFSYELRRDPSSGRTELVEIIGNLITGEFNGAQTEHVRYSFDGIPKTFEEVYPDIEIALEQTRKSWKLLSLSRFVHIEEKETCSGGGPGYKFVTVCGSFIAIVDGVKTRNLINVKDKFELYSFLSSTFPTVAVGDISPLTQVSN